jgi:purine-binding chemotaxis protein CheW
MTPATAERQVVVFSLLGEPYALPITSVREIIRYTAPGATATASGLIRGMINLRGRLLPVIDVTPLLGGQLEIAAGTRILVVEVAKSVFGMLVDGVEGIVRVTAEQIETLPAAASRELSEEIATVGQRVIVLVDPARVARRAGVIKPVRRTRRSPAAE